MERTNSGMGWIKAALMGIAVLTVALAQLAGCGSGGDGSKGTTGTLRLAITDKQSDDFAKVVIAIKEIRLVPAGKEGAPDDDPSLPVLIPTTKVVDVMQLSFAQQLLGDIVLPVGTYSQIRLILEPNPSGQGQTPVNYITLNTAPNVRIPIKTPSAQQSGLKVLGPIEVRPDAINAVLIDFDPNTAIVERGNGDYNFKPTGIRLLQNSETLTEFGSITGTIVSALDNWSSATVAIKRRGGIEDATPIAAGQVFANFTSGSWQAPFSAFVPPSSAAVRYRAFVTANRFQPYSSPLLSVVQGEPTDVGQVVLTPAQ